MGFTVVELVIVVSVIAILAAISIVAYKGVQERARDGQRMADIQHINDALTIFVSTNRRAPLLNNSVCTPAGKYDSTCYANDILQSGSRSANWISLQNDLKPYMDNKDLPVDPCGLKCYKKPISNGNNEGYYTYRYMSPAHFPATLNGKTTTITDYTILAENLEAKTAQFGYGFGSF